MPDKTSFLASLPAIQTAIKIAGNGDGARVQFDIPETSMAGFLPLLGMREQRLLITVETIDKEDSQDGYKQLG